MGNIATRILPSPLEENTNGVSIVSTLVSAILTQYPYYEELLNKSQSDLDHIENHSLYNRDSNFVECMRNGLAMGWPITGQI